MTRVKAVMADPGLIVRLHQFENFPEGTEPHTTAPLDYLVAGLAMILKPFTASYLDVAGSCISPVLGLLTAVFLLIWARRSGLSARAMLLVYAASPILVHGTVLGRPDHQSLLILLMAIAMGAEWVLAKAPSRSWALAAGIAWGLGLWVSLYEPSVLLAASQGLALCFLGGRYLSRERAWMWGALLALAAAALALEGWRFHPPQGADFQRWAGTIGEMAPGPALLVRWTGWGIVAALALFLFNRRHWPFWLILVLTGGLTLLQARWGYFLALFFAMALPFLMRTVTRQWFAWALLLLSLWPIAAEWDAQVFERKDSQLAAAENRELRALAKSLPQSQGSILAPWWLSPALSYWTGMPAVAGSSHQSLPGILDSARFFEAVSPEAAREILERRKVAWVIAGEPSRVLENSRAILGHTGAGMPIAELLYKRPSSAPAFLHLERATNFFKAYKHHE